MAVFLGTILGRWLQVISALVVLVVVLFVQAVAYREILWIGLAVLLLTMLLPGMNRFSLVLAVILTLVAVAFAVAGHIAGENAYALLIPADYFLPADECVHTAHLGFQTIWSSESGWRTPLIIVSS